jgi:type I restriction enzyme S subunit
MTSNSDNLLPGLRFERFDEQWEQRELTEVLSPTVGNNTLSRAELNYNEGEVKNVHYGDVLIKFGSFVDVTNDDIPFITDGKIADYKNNLLQDGDIIFADTAEDETAGKVVEVTNTKSIRIVAGLHTIVYRPRIKFADCFMGYYLNTNAYRYQLLPLMQGAKVLSLGRSLLATTFVRYPFSMAEQALIVKFLRNVDETIALKKQQYEQTANIKKAMLEKMFPKKGATVPEIRFGNFVDEWEFRKLADITFPSGYKNKDNIAYESYSISNENGFVRQSEQFENGGSGTMATADKRMYIVVSPQTFAYNPARINVGSIGFYNLKEDVIVSSLYEVFKTTMECNDTFLWYWMKTNLFHKQIEELQEGGVRLYFFYDKFCKSTILLPNEDEQVAIGNFFRNLDTLITTQREELEKLQNIKKACLSKMFV